MNKTNNKLIVLSLGMLAVLALAITFIPASAHADTHGYFTGYNTTNFNGVSNNNQYIGYQAPVYVPTPTYIPVSTPMYVTTSTPTVYSSTNNTVKKTNTVAKVKKTDTSVAKEKTSTDSSLAANAIFGTNSLMPSGIIQWVLFAILVLLVVMLVRKIYGADQRYHAAPMKHD